MLRILIPKEELKKKFLAVTHFEISKVSMVLKFWHILKVFKLYEGLRIYGYTSTVARIQKISREQKGFEINNFKTIGNIEKQKNILRKSLETVLTIVTLKIQQNILLQLETNISNSKYIY